MTILGYWNTRGFAQPLRYLLSYLNVQFTNKAYTGDALDWFNKDKQELGIPLPNLPYLIDGDIKLSQSNAILFYLVRKYNRFDLVGLNPDGSFSEKQIQFFQVLGTIADIRGKLFDALLSTTVKFDDAKEEIFQKFISKPFSKLVEYLGNKEFLVGSLTFVDFAFYDLIAYLKNYYPELEIPTAYFQRIENIPQIKEYLASPLSMKIF